jgi:hypothetical protein
MGTEPLEAGPQEGGGNASARELAEAVMAAKSVVKKAGMHRERAFLHRDGGEGSMSK